MLAYRVRERNKTSQTMGKKREHKKKTRENERRKQKETKQTTGRCTEECDARRSERKGCKNSMYTCEEEQIPVARTKQHDEDNCRCPGKTTRRGRGRRRYRHKAGREENKEANKKKNRLSAGKKLQY